MPANLEQLNKEADRAFRDAMEHPELVVGPMVYGISLDADLAAEVGIKQLEKDIETTAQVAVTEAFQAGQDDGLGVFSGGKAPPFATYATFQGPLDSRTCGLCASLHGQTFLVDSEDYEKYKPPLHINERHYYTYYGGEAPKQPFRPPSADLVKRHGHFVTDPEKYKPLRVPASPTGREFVFRHFRDPVTGERMSSLTWLAQPERPLSRAAMDTLSGLIDKPLVIPAEAWDEALKEGVLSELSQAQYIKVTRVAGTQRTLTVTRETAAEAEAWIRQEHVGATVESLTDAGSLSVGQQDLRQWKVVFREQNARKITVTDMGALASQVSREAAAQ